MKKVFFLAASLLAVHAISAQSWMPAGTHSPVKYVDVVANYKQQGKTNNNKPVEIPLKNNDFPFEQWAWYWRQHLDENGNIVPQVKTLQAWQQYAEQTGGRKAAARSTSALPSNWVFQGPGHSAGGASGMGRINTIAFDPVDSNTLYAGSAAGGTWKTTDGGATWFSLYDFLPTLGVADIKVNQLNRNTVYVATGDGDNGDAYSSGVIVSHDGGASWLTTGLLWAPTDYNYIRSMAINPLDTNSVVLATNVGIYKSYDAGSTWMSVAPGDFKQILYKPGDSSILYGTIYTDTSAQIVRSVNGGNTWTAVTSFTDAQRINIAVCPSSPAVVKAVAANASSGLKGIYSSADNGATYTAIYTEDVSCAHELLGYDLGLPTFSCGGQAAYALCIAMNPANASDVTVGAINTYYSSTGGASWQIANGWYDDLGGLPVVHANKHCLAYSPLTGALFETCDGGVYKNYGPLTAPWTDISNGLCVTQFYRCAIDNAVPFYIGGASGNGTKMMNGSAVTDLMSGVGTQPLINYGDPSHVFYWCLPNGYMYMTRDAGAHYGSITDVLTDNGGFISPYVIHPTDTATLLLGYRNVYITHDNGVSWRSVSPVFDTGAYINYMAIAYTNPDYIYTAQDEANASRSVIHYTANAGVTWDSIHIPFTNLISGLVTDPKNEKRIWVTVSGYGAAKVYGYNLATGAWTNESGTLPNLPVNCMVIDTASRCRYIGTDAAVFFKDTTMSDWALYNNNLPTAHIYDLKINYTTGQIWAATFGRGMWKTTRSDNPGTLAAMQAPGATLMASPNPAHEAFVINTTNTLLAIGKAHVRLTGPDGKDVLNMDSLFDGSGNMKVNLTGVAAGVYICEVNNSSAVARIKVVVE